MNNKKIISGFNYVGVVGNIILMTWLVYSGVKEGFKVPIIAFIGLLVITSLLLIMKAKEAVQLFLISYSAIAGNILFVLFILYNGINEGFKAPIGEMFYYISVMVLLVINIILLITRYKYSIYE